MKDPTSPSPTPEADPPKSTGELFAEVAVNLPIRHPYTYKVPERLRGILRVGGMVAVPVINRVEAGVVVGLGERCDIESKRIKSIRAVLSPDYHIPPDLLDLARWMTEYYLGGPGETLSSVSFFGLRDLKTSVERRLLLAEPDRGDLTREGKVKGLTPRQREVAASFLRHDNQALTRAQLIKRERCSASVIEALIQKGVLVEREIERARVDPYHAPDLSSEPHTLLPEQQAAHDAVAKALHTERFEVFLLYGITGSGKTEIYLQSIAQVLERGHEAICLVPEISLTPQAVERFRRRFGSSVGVYHSAMTPPEKLDLWKRIEKGETRVLIGARSAVFAPFPRLGLIVVDEEHEHSYKQSDPAPRYHARDVAIWRARQAGAPILLGSATPSLESVRNCDQGKFTMLRLTRRVGEARLPDIHLVDMGREAREAGETGQISAPLREAIAARIRAKEQSILFLNRRGFANFMLCLSCKTALRCAHCDVVMTWHKSVGKMICHFCGSEAARPVKCPECGAPDPAPMGAGTQRVEEELAGLFPEARVLRVDLDTAGGRNGFLNVWERIEGGDYDILLGTQMIAKGLHLENVTLVGVVSADHMLFLPDFRSAERTFALLTQVAGRAGRMLRHGEVFIQSFIPHHYAIQRAIRHDTEGFWKQELRMREMMGFPPFFRLLLVRLSGESENRVRERALRLGEILRENRERTNAFRPVKIFGPAPSPISRIRDKWRWQIVIRDRQPSRMRELLDACLLEYEKDKGRTGVHLIFDMDPMDLL
jgi:primosomal protein N' (replication factor Y)